MGTGSLEGMHVVSARVQSAKGSAVVQCPAPDTGQPKGRHCQGVAAPAPPPLDPRLGYVALSSGRQGHRMSR